MKVIIHGTGTMSGLLKKALEESRDLKVAGFADELTSETGDVIISFSHFSRIPKLLDFATTRKIPLLIATTGYTAEDLALMKQAGGKIPLLLASNVSLGINILVKMIKAVTPLLYETFDIEIVEKHHNKKLDAPSGTAKTLAEAAASAIPEAVTQVNGRAGNKKREKYEIGVSALRGGTIAGEHAVYFCGDDEIIELKHTAASKAIFVRGAITAARLLVQKKAGFYTMEDII
ncbi:MAG: 4-hydroxy-tetrahydrodipicolinate reductase [Fusobacteriaceae bacterium]|jgi:4-hydroxy-tetrahydrodipicolinate reductase|nr:4-hydroxy-tetrahydrodipicolinate reductase [Fusobacteriaceae bacterium]